MSENFYEYAEILDRNDRSIRELMQIFRISRGKYDLSGQYKKILDDLYTNAVVILDKKIQAGETLDDLEKQVYDNCKKELGNKNVDGLIRLIGWGVIGNLLSAYEVIYHMLPTGKADAEAQKLLSKKGSELLPGYISFLSSLVNIAGVLLGGDIKQFIGQTAVLNLVKQYRVNIPDNKQEAQIMLECANNAYSGKKEYAGFRPLPKNTYPTQLQPLYDETSGFYNGGHGLKVWTAMKGDDIVVAFSGTDPKNLYMDYEDFNQIFAGSVLYLEAAGFLHILIDWTENKNFFICGHSLGGGLAQFSTVANIDRFKKKYKCYAFNPAGLSINSLNFLKKERITKALNNIFVYVTCKDIVSLSGAKLGNVVTLPKTGKDGHGIDSLRECMNKYISTNIIKNTNTSLIQLDVYNSISQILPYWKSAMCMVSGSQEIYPIFGNTISNKQSKIATISIYPYIISNITTIEKNNDFNVCLGVYEYFNGDAYTVINRLMLLDENENSTIPLTRESAASIIFFGPYGMGKEEWLMEILDILSSDTSPISAGELDKYLYRLSKEYEYMLSAWLFLLKNVYGYDIYSYFENNKIVKNNALEILYDYSIKNKELFFDNYYKRKPLNSEFTIYLDRKYNMFTETLNKLGNIIQSAGMLPQSSIDFIKQDILKYLNQFIEILKNK